MPSERRRYPVDDVPHVGHVQATVVETLNADGSVAIEMLQGAMRTTPGRILTEEDLRRIAEHFRVFY